MSDMVVLPVATSYIRLVATAIAFYDFVLTLPGEWLLYKRQWQARRFNLAAVLFFLVRYISVATIVISQVGWFGSGFSPKMCMRYHYIAPVLTVVATMVSHVIISVRAYAASRKATWVLVVLAIAWVLCNTGSMVTSIYMKIPVQNHVLNCTSGNLPKELIGWISWLCALIFDSLAIAIASYYLFPLLLGSGTYNTMVALMIGEGLAYYFILTLCNVANIILFRSGNVALQTSGASLAQVATMILSERFILNLNARYRREGHDDVFGTAHRSTPELPDSPQMLPRASLRPPTSVDHKLVSMHNH